MKDQVFILLPLWLLFFSPATQLGSPLPIQEDLVLAGEPTDTIRNPLRPYGQLDTKLNESSGLIYAGGKLWSINDSGNKSEVYEIDPGTGEVLHTLELVNVKNKDWEDLAKDDKYLYVGDFGNNQGKRQNLAIYRVPLDKLSESYVFAEIIRFTYEDQASFEPGPIHGFDCEAFAISDGLIHLFTKNRDQEGIHHYSLPAQPGDQIANKVETYQTQGMITAADISDQKELLLLGFDPLSKDVMIWRFNESEDHTFFQEDPRHVLIGEWLTLGQAESICWVSESNGFISNERFEKSVPPISIPARLYRFQTIIWDNK
ncbi:MAG: hypothetical protein AAF655_20545 [Bacteroidota bacterium]